MKLQRPPGGFRWEDPLFDFYGPKLRAFCGGYEPVLAAEMCRKGSGGTSAQSTRTRDAALANGEAWAVGTVPGLGVPSDPGKVMRMLKNSKLG